MASPPQLCYKLPLRYQLKRMSFLAPWVSELGGWVCDASVAVLPTRAGAVVLLVSSELPELLGMSDRVLVLFQGRLVADLPRADADPERVLHWMMTGADIADPAAHTG